LRFRYRVCRVWREPVERFLTAGISLLPLAPISAVPKGELPAVIGRMEQRLSAEPNRTTVAELWSATKVLLGLRYKAEFIDQLLRRMTVMKESTTYQAILREGRVEQLREDVRQLGQEKFKITTPAEVQSALDNITDLEELRQHLQRILEAKSWNELLALPAPGPQPRHGRGKRSS
jgi:predicted transposase YdaD